MFVNIFHAMESSTDLSPEEKIRKLEAQVTQLKNCIKKLTGQVSEPSKKSLKKAARPFDHNLYCKRHVALHICYFGWDFHGFALQEITGKTIESEVFNALVQTRLIKCREESNYHRCGRTDKGVSAFQQVITIDLRSNLLDGPGVYSYEGCKAHQRNREEKEIDYCKILNARLPPTIQVLSWAPCPRNDFSARFDCVSRGYKYFFPRGNLDLSRLNEAGQNLLGEHDYRNFCKMDVANGVVNYTRRITSVKAECINDTGSPYDVCVLTIVGKAFLWHQIRCIVAVLFRVASGREQASVISDLLDVEKHPRRPQYLMASEIPLNLFQCEYEKKLDWQYDNEAINISVKKMQALWTESSVKAAMIKTAIENLSSQAKIEEPFNQVDELFGMSKIKNYVSLHDMDKCPSLEEKLSAPSSKRRKP